jgi:hypothetical protein
LKVSLNKLYMYTYLQFNYKANYNLIKLKILGEGLNYDCKML